MIIRTACDEDARSVAQVHVACYQRAYKGLIPDSYLRNLSVDRQQQFFQRAIAERFEEIVVIEEEGSVLGEMAIGPCRDENMKAESAAEIWGIYISPDHWRKGFGKALAQWAIRQLRSRGHKVVTLWVLEGNVAARAFYEAMGFTVDGATKEMRIGAPLTAIRYRTALD